MAYLFFIRWRVVPAGQIVVRTYAVPLVLDDRPIDPPCDCQACASGVSRSYLRHLLKVGEIAPLTWASIHNLRHYQRLMAGMRLAIEQGTFGAFRESFYAARRP